MQAPLLQQMCLGCIQDVSWVCPGSAQADRRDCKPGISAYAAFVPRMCPVCPQDILRMLPGSGRDLVLKRGFFTPTAERYGLRAPHAHSGVCLPGVPGVSRAFLDE